MTEAAPGGWRSDARPADFYAARALLEAVLRPRASSGAPSRGGPPFLHPGRAAAVLAGDGASSAGSASCTRWSRATWDLAGAAAAFELDARRAAELAARAERRLPAT